MEISLFYLLSLGIILGVWFLITILPKRLNGTNLIFFGLGIAASFIFNYWHSLYQSFIPLHSANIVSISLYQAFNLTTISSIIFFGILTADFYGLLSTRYLRSNSKRLHMLRESYFNLGFGMGIFSAFVNQYSLHPPGAAEFFALAKAIVLMVCFWSMLVAFCLFNLELKHQVYFWISNTLCLFFNLAGLELGAYLYFYSQLFSDEVMLFQARTILTICMIILLIQCIWPVMLQKHKLRVLRRVIHAMRNYNLSPLLYGKVPDTNVIPFLKSKSKLKTQSMKLDLLIAFEITKHLLLLWLFADILSNHIQANFFAIHSGIILVLASGSISILKVFRLKYDGSQTNLQDLDSDSIAQGFFSQGKRSESKEPEIRSEGKREDKQAA